MDISDHIYFITKRRRADVGVDLTRAEVAEEICSALFWLLDQHHIWLLGFVIMPDHVHVVLAPREPHSLQEVAQSLFGFSSRQINRRLQRHGALWMEEFFERHLRDEDETRQCLDYLHLNPVRKGLAQRAADWKYSSAQSAFHDKMSWAWFLGSES
ncbi:MAG: transposase [Kiritimatiellaeota bacterium]|nr:transposase [Kiritimatiellota bacterium]